MTKDKLSSREIEEAFRESASLPDIFAAIDKGISEGSITSVDADRVLAKGFRAMVEHIKKGYSSSQIPMMFDAQQLMLDALVEVSPAISKSLQKPTQAIELGPVGTGYRKRDRDAWDKWIPVPGLSPDKISSEERILEALRDKMPEESLSHVALQKGLIGGEGKLWVNVTGAFQFGISRDIFVKVLHIPKNSIGTGTALDGDHASLSFVLPEKETRQALGIPYRGRGV